MTRFSSFWQTGFFNNARLRGRSSWTSTAAISIHCQKLFESLRPDIADLRPNNDIEVLELTICHETNCNKSREYKQSRYINLSANLKTEFWNYSVVVHTIEITCLGLVSDCSQFCSNCLKTPLPDQIKNQIIRSVISSSFLIYCNRNKNSD